MSSGNTAGDLLSAGAMQKWIYVYQQSGGGARGRSNADGAIANEYPDASSATRQVIQNTSLDALAAGRRYRTAGDDYTLPTEAYADMSSYQRRSGHDGTTLYGHKANFTYYLISPSGNLHERAHSVVFQSADRLTAGEIRAELERLAEEAIARHLATSPPSRGLSASSPKDLTIQTAYRFVG